MFTRSNISTRLARGFTLIELMVVIALVGVLMAIAAPSMREMIEMRRLTGIHAQFITDLQWARSEAVSRRAFARIDFKSATNTAVISCYTIYTSPANINRCDCRTNTCDAGALALRTVVLEPALRVSMRVNPTAIAFEPAMGGLTRAPVDTDPEPLNQFLADTLIDDPRKIRTFVSGSGRPSACAPPGSKVNFPAC